MAIQGVLKIWKTRAPIIWHVLNINRNLSWGGMGLVEVVNQMQICRKRWIVTAVAVQTRPVIGINRMLVVMMNYLHVPSHEPHL
jgi:hypothetical protein